MTPTHKQALEELAEWMEKYGVVFSYRNDSQFSVGGVDIFFKDDFLEIDEEVTPDEIRYVIKEGGMSNKYKHGDYVPTDVLVNRLYELADAVTKGPTIIAREFDMRIPAELDRDADLVISQAAVRLKAQEKQNTALVELCREMVKQLEHNTASQKDFNEFHSGSYTNRLKQIIGEE